MSTLPSQNRAYDDDDDSPVDELDELLVAYLDGELDEQQRRDLEDRLILDDALRQRLGGLQHGWELLDHLPQASVTGDFAQTTVEMIAATQSRTLAITGRQYRWKQYAWLGALLTSIALCSAVGWFFPKALDELQFRRQLADLPLAEHLDAYLLEVDLGTMVKLSKEERWQRAMQLAADAGGIVVPVSLELGQRDKSQQIDVLGRMDRDAQSKLSANWGRLNALSEDRKQAVQNRYDEVRSLDHPGDVLKTMQQYASWWNQLSPESMNRIFMAKDDERIETILQIVERSSLLWVQNYANTLGETDRTLMYERLRLMARDRIDQAEVIIDEAKAQGLSLGNEQRRWFVGPERLLERIAYFALWNFDQQAKRGGNPQPNAGGNSPPPGPPPAESGQVDAGRGDAGRGDAGRPGASGSDVRKSLQDRIGQLLFSPPSSEELAAVEQVMSNKALAILGARTNSEQSRQDILWRWCAETIVQTSPRRDSAEVILDRYESLGEEYRDSLDLKSPDKIFDELQDPRLRP